MSSYALILAGGSGTRFWPLSRNERPKQLLHLFGDTTLLRRAIDRVKDIIPADHVFVLTNQVQLEAVKNELTGIVPAEQIVAEPARRDTAPAIALGAALIAAKDSEATMIVLPSDQLIQDESSFQSLMNEAIVTASQRQALITVGIKPTWPCPSYGYIHLGEHVASSSQGCYKVLQFKEKPDKDTARGYLNQGGFVWNAGMFVWSIPTLRRELREHCPQLDNFIASYLDADSKDSFIAYNFKDLTPISIDFALMEKAQEVLCFEATFDWDDVGSWISVASYLDKTEGNATNSPLAVLDSKENIIFTSSKNKTVALLGVDNLIVVDTGDALLVADRTKADSIKKLVDQLPKSLL